MELLFKGLVLGFSIAAPVGPIGILCINRTLNKGFITGLVTGLGAATADMFYGLVAGLGMSIISDFLFEQKIFLQVMGAAYLFYIGIKTIVKNKGEKEIINKTDGKIKTNTANLLKAYLSTFFLTITNPMTILFFIAVFSGIGLPTKEESFFVISLFIEGVFTGSAVWWLILSGLTHRIKHKLNSKLLDVINIFSGIIICGFAAWILIDILGLL